jgi:hypothetical protein
VKHDTESEHRILECLLSAASLAEIPENMDPQHLLGRGSFEHAADQLYDVGPSDAVNGTGFWGHLCSVYRLLGIVDRVSSCRLRIFEVKNGCVEGMLQLQSMVDGGRDRAVLPGYRPNWDVGNKSAEGAPLLHCAGLTVEDQRSILPGQCGLVRLHPLVLEAWRNVRVGAVLLMHEGSRIVGRVTVLRVTLDFQ